MHTQASQSFWDKLAIPVILMVLGGMATWVFELNADVAVLKKTTERVDIIALDQRSSEKLLILLEAQTKANTEFVQEMKASQRELSGAIAELNKAMSELRIRSYGPSRSLGN